ncbi:MAG: NADH-quinone oxidoreductase subunit NuoH [Dehalococcoidia bacterium]|nr:NADH-quinone oxidoreductase subunit NuoH [Dehalococcoidia bacterium]
MSSLPFADPIFGIPSWLDIIVRVIVAALVLTVIVIYATYGERKLLGRFQQRLGPMKTGPWGLWQGVADAVKLVGKEDIRPNNADRWVFEFAPYLTFIPIFVTLVTLPVAQEWGIRNLSLGLFFVFAVMGLNIVGIVMAGLGSGNKYALLGGVRAAAQMISYEIPLVISLLSVTMVAGTLDLNLIAAMQSLSPDEGQHAPFIALQPLAFLIFFTAMLSELHRAPFDIPVAESEVVGGYFVEYSGIRWSMFQLAEYASLFAWAIFGSVVFLGGWAVPGPDTFNLGSWWGPDWAWHAAFTIVKALLWFVVIVWIRATVPRLRIDQLMNFCWKVLLPLSLVQFLMTGFAVVYEWPEWVMAITSAAGAAVLIAIIIRRALRKPKNTLVGSYRRAQVPVQ